MTRGVDMVFYVLSQATPATDDAASSGGPIVIVLLAVITLAGTAVTAMGPTLLEIAKSRGSRLRPAPAGSTPSGAPDVPAVSPSPPNPAPPLSSEHTPASNQMVQSAQHGLGMVEAAVLDYRSQRDAAMRRYDTVLEDLEEAKDVIREQAVYIAQLEGRLGVGRRNYGGRHGPSTDSAQQGWN